MLAIGAHKAVVAMLALTLVQADIHPAAAPAARGREDLKPATSTRFSGKIKLPRHGATATFRVEVKQWQIDQKKGFEVPIAGFYIAHALSGVIYTQVAGKSEVHLPGDFWAVQPGTSMLVSIKAPQQTATLETLAVIPAH